MQVSFATRLGCDDEGRAAAKEYAAAGLAQPLAAHLSVAGARTMGAVVVVETEETARTRPGHLPHMGMASS